MGRFLDRIYTMILIFSALLWFCYLAIVYFKKLNSMQVFLIPLLISLFIPLFLITNHHNLSETASAVVLILLIESVLYKSFYEI